MSLRDDANLIIKNAIADSLPGSAVKKALENIDFEGKKIHLVAIGKAAWSMAESAWGELGNEISDGVVITKYEHSKGSIGNFEIFEAGHPVPDENTYAATKKAVTYARQWGEDDTVLFLVSGGGSALFEDPLIPPSELENITSQLLSCGADIVEINTIRKRLSSVKGGKFAQICSPAKVHAVILSDVLGNRLDSIASGPACPDMTSVQDAINIVNKYNLKLSDSAQKYINMETPKTLYNVETQITGSVSQLCLSAKKTCEGLGYETLIMTDMLTCQAKEAGSFISSIAQTHASDGKKQAYIFGGETVVVLSGKGLGGRNQEMALSAARGLDGLHNCAMFSLASDGTDGPTDAAGGYVDSSTASELEKLGIGIDDILNENDSYHALEKVGSLIITGPTGTNVNDVSVLLIDD